MLQYLLVQNFTPDVTRDLALPLYLGSKPAGTVHLKTTVLPASSNDINATVVSHHAVNWYCYHHYATCHYMSLHVTACHYMSLHLYPACQFDGSTEQLLTGAVLYKLRQWAVEDRLLPCLQQTT